MDRLPLNGRGQAAVRYDTVERQAAHLTPDVGSETSLHRDQPLCRGFYDRDVVRAVIDLSGTVLARMFKSRHRLGRTAKTKAYLGSGDPACHVAGGFTPPAQRIWDFSGTAYVLVVYGLRHCLNAITLSLTPYSGVLFRGLEPLHLRGRNIVADGASVRDGPGKASRHKRIGMKHNDFKGLRLRTASHRFEVQ